MEINMICTDMVTQRKIKEEFVLYLQDAGWACFKKIPFYFPNVPLKKVKKCFHFLTVQSKIIKEWRLKYATLTKKNNKIQLLKPSLYGFLALLTDDSVPFKFRAKEKLVLKCERDVHYNVYELTFNYKIISYLKQKYPEHKDIQTLVGLFEMLNKDDSGEDYDTYMNDWTNKYIKLLRGE